MKTLNRIMLLAAIGATFAACKGNSNYESNIGAAASADSKTAATEAFATDSADAGLAPEQRKIIKTADMRSRVKDVLASTTYLEQASKQLQGSVINSRLSNDVDQTYSRPLSADSLKQVQVYTSTASMTFKIPVQQLDSFLHLVAGQSEFINNRNLALEDVSLNYLSNKLKQDASKANTLAPKNVDNVSYIDERSEQNIDRKIENMSINEQVKYATISIELYQPQRVETKVIADVNALVRPGFGEYMRLALSNGWEVVKWILIGITNLWALLLIGAVIWISIRQYRKRKLMLKSTK